MTKKLVTAVSATAASFAVSAMPVFAAIAPERDYNLDVALSNVIDWAAIIAGIIVLIYLIVAGIKYITSSGDPGKTEEAQKQIISAIIGLAIVVLAYSLTRVVATMLGVDSLTIEELGTIND